MQTCLFLNAHTWSDGNPHQRPWEKRHWAHDAGWYGGAGIFKVTPGWHLICPMSCFLLWPHTSSVLKRDFRWWSPTWSSESHVNISLFFQLLWCAVQIISNQGYLWDLLEAMSSNQTVLFSTFPTHKIQPLTTSLGTPVQSGQSVPTVLPRTPAWQSWPLSLWLEAFTEVLLQLCASPQDRLLALNM